MSEQKDDLKIPKEQEEIPERRGEEKTEIHQRLHSIENFPPKAKEMIERDLGAVRELGEEISNQTNKLKSIEGRVRNFFNRANELESNGEETTLPSSFEQMFKDLHSFKSLFQEEEIDAMSPQILYQNIFGVLRFIKNYKLVERGLFSSEDLLCLEEIGIQLRQTFFNRLKMIVDKISGQFEVKQEERISLLKKLLPQIRTAVRTIFVGDINLENLYFQIKTQVEGILDKLIEEGEMDSDSEKENIRKIAEGFDRMTRLKGLLWSYAEITNDSKVECSGYPSSLSQLVSDLFVKKMEERLARTKESLEKQIELLLEEQKLAQRRDPQIARPIGRNVSLRVIWTPLELNLEYERVTKAMSDYNNFLIGLRKDFGKLPIEKFLFSEKEKLNFTPVPHDDYLELERVSHELVNSRLVLYHGTPIPEAREVILTTGEIRSRKIQKEEEGQTYFFLQEAAKISGSGFFKPDDHEQEQLCFYSGFPSESYSLNGGMFFVAIPARKLFRDFGFFECDGFHFFDKENPERGFRYNFKKEGVGVIVLDTNAMNNLNEKFEMVVEKDKQNLGEYLIVSDHIDFGISPEIAGAEKLPEVKNARIVPTGFFMDTPGTKKGGMVYCCITE